MSQTSERKDPVSNTQQLKGDGPPRVMARTRWAVLAVLVVISGVLVMQALTKTIAPASAGAFAPAAPSRGGPPYVILTDLAITDAYFLAAQRLQERHGAQIVKFESGRIHEVLPRLRAIRPTFVAVVLRPETLDVNVAYEMLELSCRLDDDPFPDFAYGYITGACSEDAIALVDAGAKARERCSTAPRRLFLFGPSAVSQPDDKTELNWLVDWQGERLAHKGESFPSADLSDLSGRDIIRFWGHGVPERVDDGLTAAQLEGLRIGPAVVFAGPCFSAVTHRSYEWECEKDRIEAKTVAPRDSLALSFIAGGAAGYFGALHEDRCPSAAREMEYVLAKGEPVGFAVKHTYDTVVMANRGRPPTFPRFHAEWPAPVEDAVAFQINRAASRVLLGDPACQPFVPAVSEPVGTTVERTSTGLSVEATVVQPHLWSMFMDVFHEELCTCDRADDVLYFRVQLPRKCGTIAKVVHLEDDCPLNKVKHSPVIWAEESWMGKRFLHIQLRFTHSSVKEAGLKFRFEVEAGTGV